MEGQDIRGLFEAYSKVYETTEVLNEEVEDLHEIGVNFGGQAAVDKVRAQAAAERKSASRIDALRRQRFGSGGGAPSAGGNSSGNRRAGQNDNVWKPTPGAGSASGQGGRRGSGSSPGSVRPTSSAPAAKPATPAAKPTTPAAKPAASAAKPATPAAKPAASAAPKPTAPSAPAKPAGSAMDAWAKANPKLAQAQKIRKEGGSRAEVNKVLYNKGTAAAEKTPTVVKAGVDIFDLIKGHLLGEGYAETEENALVMMANMSEDWRSSILESYGVEILDEAQEARENPEKHEEDEEKENEKKYGKVRGEKTPMPPRGDKRREDFEKWYAKNVR